MLVLVVDDVERELRNHRTVLEGYGIEVVTAATLEEAKQLFTEHELELNAVILDGCVPGHEVNTLPFIEWMMGRGFDGVLMAASSIKEYRDVMVDASGGFAYQAPKPIAAKRVVEILTS